MRRQTSDLNLLIGVDKPFGLSSHDVVNRVRRALGERRVGHAGTLDPAATGVLLVGVGQATRLLGMLTAERKGYLAEIAFGHETDTCDAQGTPTVFCAPKAELADEAVARAAVSSLVGTSMQVPPTYSAIKVDGKRSYARARAGEDFELPARPIEVFEATLACVVQEGDQVIWQLALTVSKGTYVRAIARDLGRLMGSAAHLSRLVRTSSGALTFTACVPLDEVEARGAQGIATVALDPVAQLDIPRCEISEREVEYVRCGRALRRATATYAEGERVALVCGGLLHAIAEAGAGRLAPKTCFASPIVGVRP